jgi:predicted DNA-binding ribbon-helix-helix protein
MVATKTAVQVVRVQTGVRVEKRILKVLKALAAHKELSLSDLLEGIILHSFENKPAFSPETLSMIATLRQLYQLDLTAEDSHRLEE